MVLQSYFCRLEFVAFPITMFTYRQLEVGSRASLPSLSLWRSKCRKPTVSSGFGFIARDNGDSVNARCLPSLRCHNSSPRMEERLKMFNVDSTFVVEPENRQRSSPNPDNDNIPVIDLSPFFDLLEPSDLDLNPQKVSELVSTALDGDHASLQGLISEVKKACEDWGFFQVTGHTVPLTLVDDLQKVSREFFDLPLEEKRKIGRSFANFLGYSEAVLAEKKRNWLEVVDIASGGSVELPVEVHGEEISDETITFLNQWSEKPTGFREVCEKFIIATETLASHVMGIISLSLGLPFDHFHPLFEDNTSVMRLNYYPKCPVPDLTLGLGSHKDWGALTVLVQNEVGGLEVRRKDGEWISVEPRRDAFVINLADMFQVWSNDKYHSVEHRAVVNENKDRFSFPLFYNPSSKTRVEPIPELLDKEHPPKYRAYSWGLFQKSKNHSQFKQLRQNIDIQDFAI